MIGAHRRHDMSDHIWSLLEPRLPGRKGFWGGIAPDNKLFIMQEGIFNTMSDLVQVLVIEALFFSLLFCRNHRLNGLTVCHV
ncbi:hypothetical protein HCUR_00155 [Holospora curviuscula]|uniref:Transposase n=1 Tax=Holospora curviuscula TaxID=1082868 RepID=A0A2S5REF3_9PROT|nr:hypothetical protein HCUR_00994 [Holospora curviuscula]PPE05709.1 hypothetical protein HCUR_00155 [Holospora curviuscula]